VLVGVRLGRVIEVDDVVLSVVPVTSVPQVVDVPVLLANSCASSSAHVEPRLEEYVTVIVEAPVVSTVPSQSSLSTPPLAELVTFVHVDPPPLTEVIDTDPEYAMVDSTKASPAC
jgi:hypothetical protein